MLHDESETRGLKTADVGFGAVNENFKAAYKGFGAVNWGFGATALGFGGAGKGFGAVDWDFGARDVFFKKGRERASEKTFVAPQMWRISVGNLDTKLS